MYCFNCMNLIGDDGYCPHCRKNNIPRNIAHHLKPGTVLNNKYLIGNALGEGGFGITYIGRDLTLDVRVAVKEYYPSGYVNRNNTVNNSITLDTEKQRQFFQKGKDRFLQEARSLARLSDENGVVLVRDYFENCGTAYIVMEYLDGITLQQYLRQHRTMEAESVFRMMLPMISALERMHNAHIIHRDISPDNIMYLRDGSLKLMDFGSARYFTNGEKDMSVMIKQGYAPEEQYRRNGDQGPWTDVYGLCATIYKCITGEIPEDSLTRAHDDTLQKPSELGISIDPQLEATLMYGLAVHQSDRCQSMTELKRLITSALERIRLGAFAAPYAVTQLRDGAAQNAHGSDDKGAEEPPAQKKKSAVPIVVAILTVLLLAGIGVLIFMLLNPGGSGNGSSSGVTATQVKPDATQKPTATQAPTVQETTEAPREAVEVPDVIGMSSAQAINALSDKGLVAKPTSVQDSSHEKDQVFDQTPKSGTEVEPGAEIVIYIAEGSEETQQPATAASTVKNDGGSGNNGTTDLNDPRTASKFTSPHSSGDTLYCRGDWVTLRDRESRFGESLDTIKDGQSVTYLDTSYDFYKVRFNGKEGYVLAEYFSSDPASPVVTGDGSYVDGTILFCVASDYLTLRESPSTSSAAITKIYPREAVRFIRDAEGDGSFAKVEYKGQTGYVLGKFLNDYKYADLKSDTE